MNPVAPQNVKAQAHIGNQKLKFTVVQKPYHDYPRNMTLHDIEIRRQMEFAGCCCYGCAGDECGDGK